MSEPKKPIDWAAIRSDWEKSDWSIRKIADWYQVGHSTILKKAKVEGWPERGNQEKPAGTSGSGPVIMAGVDATDPDQIVGRGHNLVFRLLDELDATTTHRTELEEMIEAHEDDPRRKAAMLKAVSLPGRADVVKALALAFKTWTEGRSAGGKKAERQANAEKAAAGESKFATRAGPRLAVNNGKKV